MKKNGSLQKNQTNCSQLHEANRMCRKVHFWKLEEYVLNRLEDELPKFLHYHNVRHTVDVMVGVELIALAENVESAEDIMLLKTAALFHDMGQIVQDEEHERISCEYAREILPQYNYNIRQIEKVCSLIMATKMPPNPQNLLECIMCDADLDYLGRADFIPVSDTLYQELLERGILNDKNAWNKQQLKFISNHTYYTEFAKKNREKNKKQQIERLRALIQE